MKKHYHVFTKNIFAIFLLVNSYLCNAEETRGSLILNTFSNRLNLLERNLPLIIKSAEAAVERTLSNTNLLINVPYGIQPSFAEEMLNRAGCLANALPTIERPSLETPDDIVLLSVRSWDKDRQNIEKAIQEESQKKHLIILFASNTGKPETITVDYFIDNYALENTTNSTVVNAIVNVVNGWLWVCEYTAALTRKGKHPSILQSIYEPESSDHNKKIQSPTSRRTLFACSTPIEAGSLAKQYITQTRKIVAKTGDTATWHDIQKAATIIANHLKTGGKVGVAAATHILLYEIFHDNMTMWKPFNVVWHAKTAFKENLTKNDLLVWFSAVGISTPLEDYRKFIKESEVRCITCFLHDKNNEQNNDTGKTLCHIEQSWELPDSVVEIPFPPGKMAPVSGINQALLYRMLDEAVAEKVNTSK